MNLDFEVLDNKPIGEMQWLLAKANLYNYLDCLKPTFFEYIIQRKIVKNRYLNSLLETVISGEPVPLITLTTPIVIQKISNGNRYKLDMESVEILDGLQRTFRLWAFFKIVVEYKNRNTDNPTEFAKHIKNDYPEFFESGIITLPKIKNFFSDNFFIRIEAAYKSFDIYFIMWNGLSPKKVINKMLVLNAGQRPVTITHQYELLFLFVWEELRNDSKVTLYRERDANANKVKLGDRKVGEYLFSSVIAGLRSFLENKPKKISIDDLDFDDLKLDENEKGINEAVFTKPFIYIFLEKLKETDEAIIRVEPLLGNKWFVRDTTLSGLLAGLGKYVGINEAMELEEITTLTNKAFKELIAKIKSGGLRLQEFQNEYINLQSRTVNVGSFLRNIIMDYTVALMTNKPVKWSSLFNKSKV